MERVCPGRREFLKTGLAAALLPQELTLPIRSKVVIARGAGLLKLVDRAVQSFYGTDSALEAWNKIARPGETVGLKVNCLAGKGISTTVALVEAIAERLQQAGIPAKNILIWDRLNEDLESAGFRVSENRNRVRCLGNDALGYEEELAMHGSAGSLLAKAITKHCDAVINLPVLKDHGIVGVTLALKNMFGAIHNPNKYHVNVGDPYVADVNMMPPIRQKVRLTICDGITAEYEGGPSYMPQWTWPFNGLLVARDPVALDTVGWQIIEAKRAEKGMKPLKAEGREPKYIATAADGQHRLGTNDVRLIDRVEV